MDHIQFLRKRIEDKLDWGSPIAWHSSMFEELSEEILGITGVLLSAVTLKRFFGVVTYEGTPSVKTLDALSHYAENQNWRQFKQSNPQKKELVKPRKVGTKSLYISIGFVLSLVTIMLIAGRRPDPAEIPEGISFSSRTVTNTFPNSVVFDFDLKDVQSDSIIIQQYWDPTKTISIDRDQKQATGIYYYPGFFQAKLLIDGRNVSQHDLFLKSDGWIGLVEYGLVPKYFDPVQIKSTSLSFPEDIEEVVTSSKEPMVTAFHYINDLGNVSGDNFRLKTTLKNSFDDTWAVCQTTMIYVLGTSGAMIIPFAKVGCSADLNLMVNDVYLRGSENDLSDFGVDLTEFTDLMINVEDQVLSVSISDRVVYSTHYDYPMGRFVGLRFKFSGLGEVQSFSVTDQNNAQVDL